ncbi:MAG: glycosyltransferase family 4 protein [Candidatus Latescibacterota bacterium]|nr:MAG: glycosyltransferase family 4 protein [Candidatus Latescibacterota bacterium]
MRSLRSFRILVADSIRIWGGAQRFIVELADGLTRRGHYVAVQTSPGTPLATRARERRIPVREVRTRADSAPWTVFPLAVRLRREPFDFVITTFDKDLRTTGLAARLAGRGTIIIHTRECDDPVKDKPRYRWFYTRVADHILVNSQATLDTTLSSAPWLDKTRASVLYKGIDLGDYADPDPGPWRRRLDPTGDRVVVGYAGQLIGRKRIDVLMRLLASPELASLPWCLAIAGKGPTENHLREEAGRLGLDGRVKFCGFVDAVHQWMAAIDVFALPSFIEGFGYVLAEAGAAGKPSVAYRASSIPEVVVDGDTALLAPKGDDAAFAANLKKLIVDAELRHTLGAAARRDVFQRHGLDSMIERMERILTGLHSAKTDPPGVSPA